jgi:peroxiredoxin
MAELLSKGITAPDLTVNVKLGQKPSRHGLRGNPIVLAFCPADWSSFCGDQVMLYNETLPDLQKYDSEPLGVSVEDAWCHAAFAKDRHLHFLVSSDLELKVTVARQCRSYSRAKRWLSRTSAPCHRPARDNLEVTFGLQ